jgi:hypothetical protein
MNDFSQKRVVPEKHSQLNVYLKLKPLDYFQDE